MASRVSRCSLLPLYADAGLTNKDKINLSLSLSKETQPCVGLFFQHTHIGRWGRAATEWRAATAESAESEPWPIRDAPGRKDCGVAVAVVAAADDGVVGVAAAAVGQANVRSNHC